GGPVGDSELLLCHGMVCVVGRMRDLILQLSKSSIYSTKPLSVWIWVLRGGGLVLKIALRISDGVKRAVLRCKLARLT
ncbi:hypothetical protein JEK46_26635, partial [Klebsiella pneumoniae]|nr:hypothetical protein [Klebsiella pneumoniae]